MLKYKIITYGCQMNIHESEKLAGIVKKMGYTECEEEKDADLILFNTCCVRENAEQHAYGNIGNLKKLKKQKPSLIIAVGGCMMQQKGSAEKLHKTFPFVDLIFGTFNSEDFERLLTKKLSMRKALIEILDKNGGVKEGIIPFRTSYPNAWVNIMYGCNNFCSYCIVPYVRGRERSRQPSDIIAEVKSLIAEGYKEITLLGQNVNSYGKDLDGSFDFSSLLQEIDKIEGKYRLRFMSSHPKDFTEKLVESIKNCTHVCHSVHLPAQAGNDRILKLMNRRYTKADYLAKIKMLKDAIPDCVVTTDLMVGFPTETEEEFLDTVDLMERVQFAGAFTFVYSKRSGTPAAEMEGQIAEEVTKERIMKLVALQNDINHSQSAKYEGSTVEILCEDFDEKKEMYMGRDEYGRMAYFKSDENLIGSFVDVKIIEAGGISLLGEKV